MRAKGLEEPGIGMIAIYSEFCVGFEKLKVMSVASV